MSPLHWFVFGLRIRQVKPNFIKLKTRSIKLPASNATQFKSLWYIFLVSPVSTDCLRNYIWERISKCSSWAMLCVLFKLVPILSVVLQSNFLFVHLPDHFWNHCSPGHSLYSVNILSLSWNQRTRIWLEGESFAFLSSINLCRNVTFGKD